MKHRQFMTKLKRFQQRLSGSTIEYDLKQYYDILDDIKQLGEIFEGKTDDQLKQLSEELRTKAQQNSPSDELLVEAYALVREVVWRVLQLKPFDVQIIGGIVMHEGKLAEMQTGEGKTISAVFPAYLNALTGQGVHVLTFNDYLARRDARWMGPIYQFLGLTVGYIQEGMPIAERQSACASDITYVTAKEAGFDFLRDSLCYQTDDQVHRTFNFAIIDEVDSILIDEARIPLIIAGASDESIPDTYRMATIARSLEAGFDVEFDDHARNVYLTESGLARVEELLRCDNLYTIENIHVLARVNSALHAKFLLHRDVDYIVRNEKIEIVDEFTGRVADRQRWPDGLQAALEAKEKVSIKTQGTILNSITLQRFIQMYPKICGMTGTVQSAETEFQDFYNLEIVAIPPNKPCIRTDHEDIIYRNKSEKQAALIDEILDVNHTGRPVLVGTRSVEESTILSQGLQDHGIKCEVLNAKNDEHEAQIVAQAGKLNAVTISTNMAGRGTDIRLGGADEAEKQSVVALGGLYVIGTNKHESERIDNQLRGRAGRQGDPGSSRFYISFEDDLFIKYRLRDLLPTNLLKENQSGVIDSANIRRGINSVQRTIEGQYLEIKKTLCKYSEIVEQQQNIIFSKRNNFLQNTQAASDFFETKSPQRYHHNKSICGDNHQDGLSQKILLRCIDKHWAQHLADIADIREGIHLHRIGGRVPHVEFQKRAIYLFDERLQKIDDESIDIFDTIRIDEDESFEENERLKAPSATWTYLVNDDPFDNLVDIRSVITKVLRKS